MHILWILDCKIILWKCRTTPFLHSYVVLFNLQAASRFTSITCCQIIWRDFSTCGVEFDGFLKEVTTLPGIQSFTSLWGIPPGGGFVWFVENLHELTQNHLLGLLQRMWKSPAPREPESLQTQTTISFHPGCHALKKICGNLTCPSCFTGNIKH